MFVPQAVETFAYNDDGNLASDGRWNYAWDGENRLISVEAIVGVPVEAKQRLEFVYDWMGRRIQKKVYVWDVPTSTYQLPTNTKFVYDGWNLMAELDGNNNLLHSYVRSANQLLFINGGGNTYQVGYDGNENVVMLVKGRSQGGTNLYAFVFNNSRSGIDILGLGTFRLGLTLPPHPKPDASSGKSGDWAVEGFAFGRNRLAHNRVDPSYGGGGRHAVNRVNSQTGRGSV